MQSKINQAVKSVREDLADGMGFAEAVAQASEIFELAPALVERKFYEQFKLAPEQVAALGPSRVESKQSQLQAVIDKAVADYGRHPMLGRRFKHNFKEHIFIGFVEGAKYPVVAVEVDSQQVWLMASGYLDIVLRSRL